MSDIDAFMFPILETQEQYEQALDTIKQEIRLEYLAMTKAKRKGFFISLPKALWWLRYECKNTANFRDNFNRRVLHSKKYLLKDAKNEEDYSADYIFRNNTEGDVRIKVPWFSDKGFKKFCMVFKKSFKAMLVREYYIDLEDEYVEMLEMNIADLEAHRKKVLTELEDYREQSVLLGNENEDLKRGLAQRDTQVLSYFNQQIVLTDRIESLRDFERMMKVDYDNIEPINNPHSILRMYECTFGKPVYVYLISDTWVLETFAAESGIAPQVATAPLVRRGRPKKSAASPDEKEAECDIEEFRERHALLNYRLDMDGVDFDGVSSVWIRDYIMGDDEARFREHEFYFYFAKSAKMHPDANVAKLWETLYFVNDAHYAAFTEAIADLKLSAALGETKFKNKLLREVYKTSYDNIQAPHRDIAARMAVKITNPRQQPPRKYKPRASIAELD